MVYSRIPLKTCEFEAYVITRRGCCSLFLFELAQARMSHPLGMEEVSKVTVCVVEMLKMSSNPIQ